MRGNKKGFTLAELLIVVAIIAVLVAVAIPVFTAQLEKSREATDIANLRSAYATASAAYLSGDYKDETLFSKYDNDVDVAYYAEFDVSSGTIVRDETIMGGGKASQPGLKGTVNLPDGVFYGGCPNYTGADTNYIIIYVCESGKVGVAFQSEIDDDGSNVSSDLEDYLGIWP